MPTTDRPLLVVAPAGMISVMISENIVSCREFGYLFTFIFLRDCFGWEKLQFCVLLIVLSLWKKKKGLLSKLSVNLAYNVTENRLVLKT